MQTDPMRRDSAFTLIELLVVISVMMILTMLTVIGVARSLRSSRFKQAVGSVQEMATQARLLAIACNDPSSYFGVVLMRDPGGSITTAVVRRAGRGDGGSDREGRVEGLSRSLAPAVDMWVVSDGSDPRPLAAEEDVAWYYAPATGLPVRRQGGSFGPPGASIGTPMPNLREANGTFVFGASDATEVPVVWPSSAPDRPGLSLRSRDQQLRAALAVYASGSFASGPF